MAAPNPSQSCNLYVNDEAFFIVCLHQEKSWIHKSGPPMVKLSRDASPKLLGLSIMQVLEQSKQGLEITTPEGLTSASLKSELRFAGFENWARFVHANKGISVFYDFSTVRLQPYRREKSSYSAMADALSSPLEAESLGKAALRALEAAE